MTMRYMIQYKLEGLTEYLSSRGVMCSYATKEEAQRALAKEKRDYPDLKGWRIVRRYV